MAADAIGDAISGLGLNVPKGTTLLDMAKLISSRMFVKATKSSIKLTDGGHDYQATTVTLPLAKSSVSGTAFTYESNGIRIVHDTTITISVSARLNSISGNPTYLYLKKNGARIKSTSYVGTSIYNPTGSDVSLIYSGKVNAGDLFTLEYTGTSGGSSISSSTLSATGTN